MEVHTWLSFALASFVLSVIPGPSVLVVTGQAVSRGWRAALCCIAGEVLGGVCIMVASSLGVGTLMAASATGFQVLKWVGFFYLVYLGVGGIRAALAPVGSGAPLVKSSFGAGFWTALLNPKSLVFYLAFLSQFIKDDAPLLPQYTVLILTAASVAALVLAGYALAATRIAGALAMPATQRKAAGVGGLVYIAAGGFVAITR